jgi:polyhydroxybutyrate depolymerase
MCNEIFRSCKLWGGVVALLILSTGLGSPAFADPCTGNCIGPGDYNFMLISDGIPRTYMVHVPATYSGSSAVPLLLDLHGFSSYAAQERQVSGQLQQSDKRGFIAVWPQGIALSWNGYGCCAIAGIAQVDDVGFLRAVIASVEAIANIDSTRVFVTGISNGGAMAMRMACEAADVVRAVASVSFPLNSSQCSPAKPIGVTEIAGTADTTVPYGGGDSLQLGTVGGILSIPFAVQSAPASLAEWKAIDGCDDMMIVTSLPGDSYADVYTNCSGPGDVRVGLVTIPGGGHILYNGYVGLGYDGNNAPFDVSEYIWDYVFDL